MSNVKYSVQKSKADVKKELNEVIKKEIKKDYVKTSWENDDLHIKIEKMGSSEIVIGVDEHGNNSVISERRRKIAMMHKPFAGEVEKMFDTILTKHLGAKKDA